MQKEGEMLMSTSQLEFETTLADKAYELAKKWDGLRLKKEVFEPSPEDVREFSAKQVSLLLETLADLNSREGGGPVFGKETLEKLSRVYGVGESGNPEIRVSFRSLVRLWDES